MIKDKKAFLIILDGWGIGQRKEADAILNAQTPFFDQLMQTAPHATLTTYGEEVGLPDGQMGNSEVGHLNIGAGRIVNQDLVKINKAFRDGSFFNHPVWQDLIASAKAGHRKIHLMGLASDGGVHAHIDHLIQMMDYLGKQEPDLSCYVHAFTDGRDTDPKSGLAFIERIIQKASAFDHVALASVIGRYYSMDRDQRWERIQKAYDLLTQGVGEPSNSITQTIQSRYAAGETDEFLLPIWNADVPKEDGTIQEGDVVLFFNFRTDRPRQITRALTQESFPEAHMSPLTLDYYTMTRYDESFKGLHVIFEKDNLINTIGEVLAKEGKTQVRIAETEKYPHVTFFFSGGRETPFDGESRILVNSPKVATYDLQPEMSAFEVSRSINERMKEEQPDFICLNYANADMVGHTGVFEAAVKAAEAVDQCLATNVETGLKLGYDFIIIADHGNSDCLINEDGSPNTAHTMNPVPIIYVSSHPSSQKIQNGILADVAPTILSLMGITPPPEMTGENLIA